VPPERIDRPTCPPMPTPSLRARPAGAAARQPRHRVAAVPSAAPAGPEGPPLARRPGADAGQAVPLLALLVLLAGLVAVALANLGGAAVARARARTAADAAALAGAADGEDAAVDAAEANGAQLVAFERDGGAAEVTVRLHGATASARAAVETGGPGAGAAGDVGGLVPAMAAAVERAGLLLGEPVPVVSGYRSTAEQAVLWANRATNPFPVAAPGTSMHERGLAIDVPSSFVPTLLTVAGAAGLCQPLPATDPVHFELCGARAA
jgi:D-alanyl-D-alanine carboxypeptidase/Putative Flp pilus-assembly TadE/G-like